MGVEKFTLDAEKINSQIAKEAAILDDAANIAKVIADFSAFNGITLKSPYTTLVVNTGSYTGSGGNAIDISIDGGGVWTTVTAHANVTSFGITNASMYFKADKKTVIQYSTDGDPAGTARHPVTASTAYGILRALEIHKIMA